MIPLTLTSADAQHLLDRGRARQHGAECLTTPRAIYYWNDARQCYAREQAFRPSTTPPRTPEPAWDVLAPRRSVEDAARLRFYRLGSALAAVLLVLVGGPLLYHVLDYLVASGLSPVVVAFCVLSGLGYGVYAAIKYLR